MFNRALIIAGLFTIGAAVGATMPSAEAASVTLSDVVILSSVPRDACTVFAINADDSATCADGDIAGTYDSDHYAIQADTDGEGFYLVVWQ